METRIFFDLDGVLADMQGGLMENSELVSLRAIVDDLINSKFPEYKNLVDDDIKSKFKAELEANPESPVKELKKAFNKYNSKVFSVAGKPGFYENLPLMPGAHEMVDAAIEIFGKKPNILSAPVGDENDLNNPSVIEKRSWVKKHFGDKVDQVIITVDKGSVVQGKSDILIDDRPKYVKKFTDAGGTAILHKEYKATIAEMKQKAQGLVSEKKWIKTFESFRK